MNREDPGDIPESADEREFEAYLKRRSLLAEHGGEDAAPPPALDAEVLRAAHEAVAPARRAPRSRWALPGSLAAAVLVSLAFMMHSGMQKSARSPVAGSAANAPAESSREFVAAERAASVPSRAQGTEQGTAAVQAPAAGLNAPSAARKTRALEGSPAESDPQAWLARIAALRAEGKQHEADAELQRLRAAFPDYPLTEAQNADATAKHAAPAARTPK